MEHRLAALGMYPYGHLRPATDALWDRVRRYLGRGGSADQGPDLDWNAHHIEVCRQPELLLAQTCGWPLVASLAGIVRVVGTFDYDVPDSVGGTYCSLLVCRAGADPDTMWVEPVANDTESLSGYISLRAAARQRNRVLGEITLSGSHLHSVRAVAEGAASVAAIDAVSWVHIGTADPDSVAHVEVVGRCPPIPCPPLVTRATASDAELAELRAALEQAVDDPAVCAPLRIRRFLPVGLAHYEPARRLGE